ncbi:ADP-ribosylation factor-like protein 6-interacting protein 1 [Halocaridina rubra]|uniref:ADP-ribosylation factor-like protein 6-interacting protein 1 n=1 Tax=Halocaridina rubra TaxID=373956 RepID=A0AAN8WHI0_HALRR
MEVTQDKDRRIKTLRRELEGWREVLCAVYSVLIWEKQYFPAISISAVTTLFMLVWYIEPSEQFLSFTHALKQSVHK